MKVFIFLCLSGVLFAGEIIAQSPRQIPENWYCDARWKADLIFTGTVKEIKPFKNLESEKPIPPDLSFAFRKTVSFSVGKIYKGLKKEEQPDEISIHTVSRNGENPFLFKTGEKYLVYVSREGVIPISKSWIYADVVFPDGFTAPIDKATETAAFLEKVYRIDFDSVRDILGYKGNSKAIAGGLISGKATRLIKPSYPKEAKKTKAYGTVKILVLIDETGKVFLAKALCPTNSYFAEAAEKAALASSFSPTMLSGKAVKVSGVVIYNFLPQ